MNPVTADFLARLARLSPEDVSLADAAAVIRMVKDGDLIHIDALAAAAEAHGFRLEPVVVPIVSRTADSVWTDADYNRSRGGM